MKNIAVATRYANALYEEAKAEGVLDAIDSDMSQLSDLVNTSREFSTLVETAALSINEKLAVIHAIGQSDKINRLTYGLLVILTKNSRLPLLVSVIEAVRKRIISEKGEVEVLVSYAAPVDDLILAELKAQLTKLVKKEVVIKENVDPSLLGGMRILLDSKLYDLSVRGRLDALRNELAR